MITQAECRCIPSRVVVVSVDGSSLKEVEQAGDCVCDENSTCYGKCPAIVEE